MVRGDERRTLRLALPEGLAQATVELIRLETAEIETATGHRVVESQEADLTLRWALDPGADASSVRSVSGGYQATVRTLGEVTETLGLLHGLDGYADMASAADRASAVERLDATLRGSLAAAHRRRIDWDRLRLEHEARVLGSDDALPAFQRWLAELGDVHTSARSSIAQAASPYVISATPRAVRMMRVPERSAASEAGVRPGWILEDEAGADWWDRCGAPPHARDVLAGRRLACAPVGAVREFVALSPHGRRVGWQEAYERSAPGARCSTLTPGVGLMSVDGWSNDVVDEIDAGLDALRRYTDLVLDLRGNVGGNLVAAVAARQRFLRDRTVCGTIRYTDGQGALGRPYDIVAEPSDTRWPGRLVVLTDALTASAGEDFLLGLQGLAHVRVVGATTAGGSGRPLTRHLVDDVYASISTALTYDRDGRCVEGEGLAPDVPSDPFDERALIAAALSLTQ